MALPQEMSYSSQQKESMSSNVSSFHEPTWFENPTSMSLTHHQTDRDLCLIGSTSNPKGSQFVHFQAAQATTSHLPPTTSRLPVHCPDGDRLRQSTSKALASQMQTSQNTRGFAHNLVFDKDDNVEVKTKKTTTQSRFHRMNPFRCKKDPINIADDTLAYSFKGGSLEDDSSFELMPTIAIGYENSILGTRQSQGSSSKELRITEDGYHYITKSLKESDTLHPEVEQRPASREGNVLKHSDRLPEDDCAKLHNGEKDCGSAELEGKYWNLDNNKKFRIREEFGQRNCVSSEITLSIESDDQSMASQPQLFDVDHASKSSVLVKRSLLKALVNSRKRKAQAKVPESIPVPEVEPVIDKRSSFEKGLAAAEVQKETMIKEGPNNIEKLVAVMSVILFGWIDANRKLSESQKLFFKTLIALWVLYELVSLVGCI